MSIPLDSRPCVERIAPEQRTVGKETDRDTHSRFLDLILDDADFLEAEFAAIAGGLGRPMSTDGSHGRHGGTAGGPPRGGAGASDAGAASDPVSSDAAGPAARPPPDLRPLPHR